MRLQLLSDFGALVFFGHRESYRRDTKIIDGDSEITRKLTDKFGFPRERQDGRKLSSQQLFAPAFPQSLRCPVAEYSALPPSPSPRDSENWIYSRIDKPSHKSVHYRPVKFSMRAAGSIVHADCTSICAPLYTVLRNRRRQF